MHKKIDLGEKIVAFIYLFGGLGLMAIAPLIFLVILKQSSIWMVLMMAVGFILFLLSICAFVHFADEKRILAELAARDAQKAAMAAEDADPE